MLRYALLLLCVPFVLTSTVASATTSTRISKGGELSLTLLADGRLFVRDRRQVDLQAGENRLALEGIDPTLQMESVLLRPVDGEASLPLTGLRLDHDLVTSRRLLETHVGKTLPLRRSLGNGKQETVTAEILAATPEPVLRIEGQIETGIHGVLLYPSIPDTLQLTPHLSLSTRTTKPATRTVELCYLSRGPRWQADYVAELSSDTRTLQLESRATLDNRSDTLYRDAKLTLMAGSPARPQPLARRAMLLESDMVANAPPEASREAILTGHLYHLPGRTTLAPQQRLQLPLMPARRLPVTLEYRFDAPMQGLWPPAEEATPRHAALILHLNNSPSDADAEPLPAGTLRLYRSHAEALQLLGEPNLSDTPVGGSAELPLGEAFDVTAKRQPLEFTPLKRESNNRTLRQAESRWQLELHNGGDKSVTTHLVEHFQGGWEILESSHPYKQESASSAGWQIEIPPGARITMTYRVRLQR